jgi:hypothetical protein
MFSRSRAIISCDELDFLIKSPRPHLGSFHPRANFFFESGSSALEWLLRRLREELGGDVLKIGIQVFTCDSVLRAIFNSGNAPVFMDICADKLTSLVCHVSSVVDNLDVLILTNLIGAANPDYIEIKSLCVSNDVHIIHDMALTLPENDFLDTLPDEDSSFFSFGFDKPVSAGFGGLLRLGYSQRFVGSPESVPMMPRLLFENRIKSFILACLITDPEVYNRPFYRETLCEKFLIFVTPRCFLTRFHRFYYFILASLFCRMANRLLLPVSGWLFRSKVYRLPDRHVEFILQRIISIPMLRSLYSSSLKLALPVLAKYQCKVLSKAASPRTFIVCQDRDALVNTLGTLGIEAGNHNWPKLLVPQDQYCNFPGASSLIGVIVSVPTWSKNMWVFK